MKGLLQVCFSIIIIYWNPNLKWILRNYLNLIHLHILNIVVVCTQNPIQCSSSSTIQIMVIFNFTHLRVHILNCVSTTSFPIFFWGCFPHRVYWWGFIYLYCSQFIQASHSISMTLKWPCIFIVIQASHSVSMTLKWPCTILGIPIQVHFTLRLLMKRILQFPCAHLASM